MIEKLNSLSATALLLSLAATSLASARDLNEAVSVNYGLIENIQTVDIKASHAGGALLGGLAGALAGGDHKAGWAVGGALLGAGAEGMATKGNTAQQYTVKLVSGGSIQIATEQNDLAMGDCVSVEQGSKSANIRRVAAVNCEPPEQVQARHVNDANTCADAKQTLKSTPSSDDKAFNAAMKQVTLECYD